MREKISIDKEWKFHYGDIPSVRNRWAWGKSGSWNQGPESKSQDDSDWRTVDIPHDFVIETKPYAYMEQEFDDDNVIPLMEDVGNIHTTAGSFEKNIGWYRKHFFIPKEDEGRKIYLVFDGVYRNSYIYLNEFFIDSHRSGYTGMKLDITDFVNYGGDNLLVVKCDSREAEGWFYEGGGIYRHAYLIKTEKCNIENVFVDYDLDLVKKSAKLKIHTEINNEENQEISIVTEIFDKNGKSVVKLLGKEYVEGELGNINLWDTENPYLYTAVTTLFADGEEVDKISTRIGFRKIEFDADRGFYLNGKNLKLKGVCCHQNHGGLGTALPDEIYRYRIGKLKGMGTNAYRCAHYPQAAEMLDVCDEMGMLVMDETRLLSSANDDLEQLEFLVKRDRNHPSVILYSIGNEEAQSQATPQGGRIAGTMMRKIKKLDNSRPVTMALLMWDLKNKVKYESTDVLSAISEKLDVAGFNYHTDRWEEFHIKNPNQPMVSTEMGTFGSTRGCYDTDAENCHRNMMDIYDNFEGFPGEERWKLTADSDYISGLFLWTGFDYYGEPTPYAWPAISSQFGIMDICGYPKDYYYYYKSWWTNEDVVHLSTHWNFNDGEKRNFVVFSNCEEVEIFINGVGKGKKAMEKNGLLLFEEIEYQKGELKAVGYKDGKAAAEHIVKTAGETDKIEISVDYKENDIAVIKAVAFDKDGNFVPTANNAIEFALEGNVKILGTSNGDPSDHTLVSSAKRRVFNGLAQAIVKFDGKAAVEAKCDGIKGNKIEL